MVIMVDNLLVLNHSVFYGMVEKTCLNVSGHLN